MSRAGQCNPLPTRVVVKRMFCSGASVGAPGTCPIGPMVNRALECVHERCISKPATFIHVIAQ